MKEVWVVEAGWRYEGSDIIGIYKLEEKAKEKAKSLPLKHEDVTDEHPFYYDFVLVNQFEIQ